MLSYIKNQDRKHIISEKPTFLAFAVLNWIVDIMLKSLKQLHNYYLLSSLFSGRLPNNSTVSSISRKWSTHFSCYRSKYKYSSVQ